MLKKTDSLLTAEDARGARVDGDMAVGSMMPAVVRDEQGRAQGRSPGVPLAHCLLAPDHMQTIAEEGGSWW